MSVIFFGPDELGQVAALAVGNTACSEGKRQLDRFCEALSEYSGQNAAAYSATYREDVEPHSVEEIRAAARVRDTADAYKRAIGTLQLLRYNLVSNGGQDFATVGTLSAILSMMQAIHRRTIQNNLRA